MKEPPIGVERYETTWYKFKDAVKQHRYGAYWRDVVRGLESPNRGFTR
jgi:hypothetical protein